MDQLTKKEACETVQRLIIYLKQQLPKTNLEKEHGSRAHRFITQYFNDFKMRKDRIEVLAAHIADDESTYFGPITKNEMIAIADVFDYDASFIPATAADLKAGRTKVSSKWTKAIFVAR